MFYVPSHEWHMYEDI